MACAFGCAHQLPRIGSPAIHCARLGTGPRADNRTKPWRRMKFRAGFEFMQNLHFFRFHFGVSPNLAHPLMRTPEPRMFRLKLTPSFARQKKVLLKETAVPHFPLPA